jgi:hypothetical protein
MDIISLLIGVATMWHWHLKACNIRVREFMDCSPVWREWSLMRAMQIIEYN